MLQALVRDLKQITDQVEALKDTLLMQDTAPKDLLSLLASTGHHFLTVQKLATILNVDRRTIYGLRYQGLPSHRVGKELRFDPLEVATWLKKRQHT